MRVALITGASGGIGAAIVEKLYSKGIIIALHYSSGKERAQAIRANREGIYLFQQDFKSKSPTLVSEVIARLGRLDYLINCAGVLANESFFELDADSFDTIFEINTRMPYLLSVEAFEFMKKQKFGRIINISSVAVKYGMGRFGSIHYAGSKAALEALTTGLSRLGAEFNILVNTVRPGAIKTEMQKGRVDLKQRIEMIPVKRMGKPEEVAALVGYLLSENGNFITGETITIAGGD